MRHASSGQGAAARGAAARCVAAVGAHMCAAWVGAHRHVWRLGGGQAQGAVLAKLKGYSHPAFLAVAPPRDTWYAVCTGLFPLDQRGELLALGDLDISGAAALALWPAVRCKRPPSCRLFPTNSASVRRNPTCTGNAARGGRLCVTTQRLERTGHGHTGAQDDSARRRKALLQLPSAVLCRGCHALAQHCAQREERTGTDLATT